MSNTPQHTPAQPLDARTTAALTVMLLVDSLHLIFARALAPLMSPFSSSFYVLAIATIQIALYVGLTGRVDVSVFKKHIWFFVAIGFLVAASTVLGYFAVTLIDAGTASLLGHVSIVVTLALSTFWLKERLSRQELAGAVLCLLGAFTISFQDSDVLRAGSLLVLASVSMYALHIAVVKRYGEGIEFANFFLFRLLMTTLFLALFMGVSGNLSAPPNGRAWLILFIAASMDVVLSRILYYWVLRRMRLGIHTILLTLSPVLTVGWSILLFSESPTWQSAFGGVLVLVGIIIVGVAQQRGKLAASKR